MMISNDIVRWLVIILMAYGYGILVQRVLAYDRRGFLMTLSIGAVGIVIGKYLIPFSNIHRIFNLGGVPIIASLIGSFIIPSIMFLLRKETPASPKGD